MKMTMHFEGGDALAAKLSELSIRLQKSTMRDVLLQAGEPMRRKMAENAPRGTPVPINIYQHVAMNLVRSEEMGDIATIAIGPTKDAFYGLFQEIGTAHHAAQPFARPAFETERAETLSIAAKATWTELAGRGLSGVTSSAPSGLPGGLI